MKTIIAIITLLCVVSCTTFSQTTLKGNVKIRGNGKGGKPSPPTGGVGLLQAGDSIYSIGATSNVRDGGSITANVIGTQVQTVQGTIISCVNDTSGSWRRWCNTDFSSGIDGWVTDDRLRRVTDSQGSKSILIMRVVYPDHSGDSNPSDAQIASYVAHASSKFAQYSYGQLSSITHTLIPTTLTLPHDYSFYNAILTSQDSSAMTAAILDDAHTVATSAGFDWTAYFYNIVWIPNDPPAIYAGGRLARGAVILTFFQNNDYSVIPSILDRIGMPERANAWDSNDSTVFGSAGFSVGNGDPYDVFGGESTNADFNIYHKNPGSKWIPDANVHIVTTNGTYRIYALDTETAIASGRFYGIRMPAYINSGFCSTCTEYWIEYRENPPVGSGGISGLLINWGGKQILDMVPTTSTFLDAPLTTALSPFIDPAGHTISVSAPSGTTPKFVDVTIGGL